MCAQFMIRAKIKDLAIRFNAKAPSQEPLFKPHVFPRYLAPVVVQSPTGREIKLMQFGLIPFFEKNPKPKMVFHNARAETITEKPSFKRSFMTSRILVPMDSFFEYIWESETSKWIAQFTSQEPGELLVACGIHNAWTLPAPATPAQPPIDTFAIVTTEPPKLVSETGHDRCPLFITESNWDAWLNSRPGQKPETILKQFVSAHAPKLSLTPRHSSSP